MRPQYLKPQAYNLAKRINLMNVGSFISQFWYDLGASNKTLNDDDVINASDNRFVSNELKSDIVEIKFNKNDSEDRKLYAHAKSYTEA